MDVLSTGMMVVALKNFSDSLSIRPRMLSGTTAVMMTTVPIARRKVYTLESKTIFQEQ